MNRNEPWQQDPWIEQTRIMLDSYRRLLHAELIPREGSPLEQAQALFDAPRIVVAHGTQADPILNYGNRAALQLWELDLATFTATASRMTAEPLHRDERARLLGRTTRDGYVDDYRGIRISSSGRRFQIEQAVVWNLADEQGNYAGQAATFTDWRYVDL
jgi:hypothetical protein